MYFIGSRA